MRLSGAAQAPVVRALATVDTTVPAPSRNRISVRTYRTNYRVDTWDDGREDLYRVTYWKFGLKSVYTFDIEGHVKTLTARDTMYTFDLTVPSRMLVTSSDNAIEDVDIDPSAAIGCPTCVVTWNTLCNVGLTEVCFLNENNPVEFDQDAQDSVRRFCGAVGAACQTSAFDTCDGQCVEGDICIERCVATPPPARIKEGAPMKRYVQNLSLTEHVRRVFSEASQNQYP